MRNLIVISALFLCFGSLIAQPIYNLSGNLNGANEVGPTASAATGTISGTYDQGSGMVTLNVPFGVLDAAATGAHIHAAPAGSNGMAVVFLTVPSVTSGTIVGSYAVPPINEIDLLSGDTYINIHTSDFPEGEIRGQITATLAQSIPTMSDWSIAILCLSLMILGVVFVEDRRHTAGKI